jgi:hypothetical protein
MTGYNTSQELDVYYGLFQNNPRYGASQVKEVPPTVSKLGIMKSAGTVPAIRGSINFGKSISAAKPSQSSVYKVPTKVAGIDSITEMAIPRSAISVSEFDTTRLTGRTKYTVVELTEWYERFTGMKPEKQSHTQLAAAVLAKYNEQTGKK